VNTDTYVIGDVHGHFTELARMLTETGLANERLRWTGGRAALWFMGDFCDRGPDGIGVLDLVLGLQRQAPEAGGRVEALLGNHELVILSALFMGDAPTSGPAGNFYADWIFNGGMESDLARLQDRHVEWMLTLPSLALEGDWLLMHANSTFYLKYGSSIEEVNREISDLLRRKNPAGWDRLLGEMDRDIGPGKPGSSDKVDLVLRTYGATRLLHGHTPIAGMSGLEPTQVTQAFAYDGGRCVNVDPGMYMGGPGFVYKLPGSG
jgi:hypothetical protein